MALMGPIFILVLKQQLLILGKVMMAKTVLKWTVQLNWVHTGDDIDVIMKWDVVTGIDCTLNELKDGEKCQMGVWI